jgi:hypothetical protein
VYYFRDTGLVAPCWRRFRRVEKFCFYTTLGDAFHPRKYLDWPLVERGPVPDVTKYGIDGQWLSEEHAASQF